MNWYDFLHTHWQNNLEKRKWEKKTNITLNLEGITHPNELLKLIIFRKIIKGIIKQKWRTGRIQVRALAIQDNSQTPIMK